MSPRSRKSCRPARFPVILATSVSPPRSATSPRSPGTAGGAPLRLGGVAGGGLLALRVLRDDVVPARGVCRVLRDDLGPEPALRRRDADPPLPGGGAECGGGAGGVRR